MQHDDAQVHHVEVYLAGIDFVPEVALLVPLVGLDISPSTPGPSRLVGFLFWVEGAAGARSSTHRTAIGHRGAYPQELLALLD